MSRQQARTERWVGEWLRAMRQRGSPCQLCVPDRQGQPPWRMRATVVHLLAGRPVGWIGRLN